MSRSLTIRKPRPAEIRQINRSLEDMLTCWQLRRAEAILLYAAGMNAAEIAQALDAHPNTIRADLRDFELHALASLHPSRASNSALSIDQAKLADICGLAQQPPYELGLPYGRWSLSKLRDYLIKRRVLKTISREHLRRLLKKGASSFAGSDARS